MIGVVRRLKAAATKPTDNHLYHQGCLNILSKNCSPSFKNGVVLEETYDGGIKGIYCKGEGS